jgi:hypothetical protein
VLSSEVPNKTETVPQEFQACLPLCLTRWKGAAARSVASTARRFTLSPLGIMGLMYLQGGRGGGGRWRGVGAGTVMEVEKARWTASHLAQQACT